jgi:hypothetical protein
VWGKVRTLGMPYVSESTEYDLLLGVCVCEKERALGKHTAKVRAWVCRSCAVSTVVYNVHIALLLCGIGSTCENHRYADLTYKCTWIKSWPGPMPWPSCAYCGWQRSSCIASVLLFLYWEWNHCNCTKVHCTHRRTFSVELSQAKQLSSCWCTTAVARPLILAAAKLLMHNCRSASLHLSSCQAAGA